MINQQINLYQERFKKRRIWLSCGQLVGIVLVTLVLFAGLSFWYEKELSEAENYNLAVKQSQQQIADELQLVRSELERLLSDDSKTREIEGVTSEITARKRILGFVGSNQLGSGQGFSSSLAALSRLQIDDIWLTEIRLGESFLAIKGSSLTAGSVPVYFNGFKNEEVFNGNRFDIFEVNRQQDTDWKVDFEIATRSQLENK